MNSNRWKYEMVTVKPAWSTARQRERMQQVLDDMGNKGWELISAPQMVSALGEVTLIFKRPV